MLGVFDGIRKNFSFKAKKRVAIDNVAFQLNYRLTFLILLTSTVLVSSRQYIGEHIRCISDTIAGHVINTFCFFTTTFTIPRHDNNTQVPHPGVGPLGRAELEEEPVVHHAYYQWVPFVLFGQALMFYLPHLLWRNLEGGTIKTLVNGLEYGYLALADREINKVPWPSKTKYFQQVRMVHTAFMSRLRINKWWGYQLIFCELLNALNILAQLVITDSFLGGRFLGLGPTIVNQSPDEVDPLDVIFPKVTKCTFMKYGPTGTIQKHDALCVMALNVINEKIYTFLWFWLIFMSAVTVLSLVWRVLTLLLHARSAAFNKVLFDVGGQLDPDDFETVISRCAFSHWLFLYYLCTNMHMRAKNQLFTDLASEMRELKSNGYHDRSTLPLARRSPRTPPRTLDEPDGDLLGIPLIPKDTARVPVDSPSPAAPESGQDRPHIE